MCWHVSKASKTTSCAERERLQQHHGPFLWFTTFPSAKLVFTLNHKPCNWIQRTQVQSLLLTEPCACGVLKLSPRVLLRDPTKWGAKGKSQQRVLTVQNISARYRFCHRSKNDPPMGKEMRLSRACSIYLIIHSFIQIIFPEHMLYACQWLDTGDTERLPCSGKASGDLISLMNAKFQLDKH